MLLIECRIMFVVSRTLHGIELEDMTKIHRKGFEEYARKSLMARLHFLSLIYAYKTNFFSDLGSFYQQVSALQAVLGRNKRDP